MTTNDPYDMTEIDEIRAERDRELGAWVTDEEQRIASVRSGNPYDYDLGAADRAANRELTRWLDRPDSDIRALVDGRDAFDRALKARPNATATERAAMWAAAHDR